MSKSTRRLILTVVLLLVVVLVNYFRQRSGTHGRSSRTRDTTAILLPSGSDTDVDNPSNAIFDPGSRDNYLIEKRQYVLSYNSGKGGPNWVSWHLQDSDIGEVERQNNFHPEEMLPNGFSRITPDDYSGSGYDRGHICNSKDRTSSPEDNSETFSMANMLPQTPDLNRHVWEQLESYSRRLAKGGSELIITAGGYGSIKTIGRTGKVNVPTNCWKIIAVLPHGGGFAAINPQTRIIAVDIPNVQGIADDSWQQYSTTVREIEQKTGYDFFSKVPRDVQDAIETREDSGPM